MTLDEQLALDDGRRFQKEVGEIIKREVFTNIVETGSGVSSIYILKAMDDANIDGKLHSIDPGMWYPHPIVHHKFNLIKSKSLEAILPLYQMVGPFDMAVVDGNHDILCQTYEFEVFWQFLKGGGYLVADDVNWGGHGAWSNFLDTHSLTPVIVGDARIVRKPFNFGYCPAAKAVECHELNLNLSRAAENKWLAMGNTNSEAFKD